MGEGDNDDGTKGVKEHGYLVLAWPCSLILLSLLESM